MHIAVDDTYGPGIRTDSTLVTGNRRTHVAIVFSDADAQNVRDQISRCLEEIKTTTGIKAEEFHFVDIYNRNPPWDGLQGEANLALFEFFASIYRRYEWPVIIQTIDDRTLRDHGIKKFVGAVEGLDLSSPTDLSLLFLLIKIKHKYMTAPESINLFVDEGRRKAGSPFGSKIFHDWSMPFHGKYSSSASEPLLQIADFIAFCINRSTHLAMKKRRTEIDTWFLNLVGKMGMNCEDLLSATLPSNFSVDDFDQIHIADRVEKGL